MKTIISITLSIFLALMMLQTSSTTNTLGGNFAAHQFYGNNTSASAQAASSLIGASDIGPNSYVVGAGSVNALTATFTPATTALTAGLMVKVLPNLTNTTTNPTFAPDGLTAKTITKFGALPLVAGDYSTTQVAELVYDGTEWILLNPIFKSLAIATVASQGFAAFNTATPVTLLPSSAAAGLYAVQAYGVVNTTFTTCTTITITIGYTDNQQAQTIAKGFAALTAGSVFSSTGVVNFWSNGTAAITYTPSKTGSSCGAGVASYYLSIERVQ